MKLITNKRQKEIDEMMIKKLRFVASATLAQVKGLVPLIEEGEIENAMNRAEQVYYADNVI